MTELEEALAQQKVGEAYIENAKTVTIQLRPLNRMESLLMKIGLMKRRRVFKIYPILVGNRKRISTRASFVLPENLFTDGTLDISKAWKVIHERTDDFIYIVALCIQNNKKEPSRHLIDFLTWIDDHQFYNILDQSLSLAGIESFMRSIILIKGSNVLNVQEKVVIPAMELE
ncbi:hypothetical protein [Pedobacter antarcticus]|uniref:hypothetical protein n=1 Tax=Pedobacter antarcticus TaxID=34086 RepID=UPI00292E8D0E|nr:hypothetical protein [Pedobacter antarcticus]